MSLGKIFEDIKDAVTGNKDEADPQVAADRQAGIAPASENPLGDPADQAEGTILPASQDPLGDPADQR